jgi:LysM repeat protein
MNKPLQKLRRFFSRNKRLNNTANPDALSAAYDDDDGASRLSGAFVVVLLLHIVALVGVFAFARIKDSRAAKANETKTPEGSVPAATGSALASAAPGANKNQASAKQPTATPAPAATPTPAPTVAPAIANHNVPAATSIPVSETHTDAAKTPGKNVHVVKTGENLTKIASLNGVTVPELVKANGLKNENDIRVGQELKIPEAGKTPAHAVADTHPKAPEVKPSGESYTVKKGDNLTKISNSTGIATDVLMKLNNIKDPKKLQEGQKLKLKKG